LSDLADLRCAECGRKPRQDENAADEWRAYSDGAGELIVFCPECAERSSGHLERVPGHRVRVRRPSGYKEAIMAVVLVHQGPTVTRESYEQVVRSMMGKDRPQSPSDWPVEGLLVHVAGDGPNGFRVVDVWESEEAARRFGEQLAPHLQGAGITAEPEVYEAHAFVSA
jgi:hypothetical protein